MRYEHWLLVHLQGLEPWTHWLRVNCSTNWAKGAFPWGLHLTLVFPQKDNQWKNQIRESERGANSKPPEGSSSPRSISIGQLNTLLCLHLRPIKLVVCKWPYPFGGISNLEASFTLRCFQRLSKPHTATQLCSWRNNWCTGGASVPVLSY